MGNIERQSIYGEVTSRIIAELESGHLPWVKPWDSSACPCTMPQNAVTGRRYSGINILILWANVIERGFTGQRWLTYRQAEAAGGHVRKGEKGSVICYADRFVPKAEEERAGQEDREARTIAFLKRFTVFNVDQCEGLPEELSHVPDVPGPLVSIAEADSLIRNSGADFRIGGGEAYYSPSGDYVAVPPQAAFHEPINWFRTALHEMGQARAATWLDHMLVGEEGLQLRDAGFGAETQTALAARREWLVGEGLAQRHGETVSFAPDMLVTLRQRELDRYSNQLAQQLALPYRASADGEPVEGRLTRRLDLLSGRFALLENAHEFTLVPWREALDRRMGQTVSGMVVGGDIDWRFGRGRGGPGIS